jgi:chromosome segregation ATPase
LLFLVAETLESHISRFTDEARHREAEQARIFESTVKELAEKLQLLENQTKDLEVANDELASERSHLRDDLERAQIQIHEKERDITRLQAKNDELTGLTQRLEKQKSDEMQHHQAALRSQENKHETQASALRKEHKSELDRQKNELTKQSELAENRLMRLLDQERIAIKNQADEFHRTSEQLRHNEQAAKEQAIQLKVERQHLRNKIEELQQECQKNSDKLAGAQSRYEALLLESQGSKNDRGQLEELRSTILALKEKLDR